MDLFALSALPHPSASLMLDDNVIAALAVFLGVVAGWYFGNFREQLKAKRARAARKRDTER
jgi:hypothetical protein